MNNAEVDSCCCFVSALEVLELGLCGGFGGFRARPIVDGGWQDTEVSKATCSLVRLKSRSALQNITVDVVIVAQIKSRVRVILVKLLRCPQLYLLLVIQASIQLPGHIVNEIFEDRGRCILQLVCWNQGGCVHCCVLYRRHNTFF